MFFLNIRNCDKFIQESIQKWNISATMVLSYCASAREFEIFQTNVLKMK